MKRRSCSRVSHNKEEVSPKSAAPEPTDSSTDYDVKPQIGGRRSTRSVAMTSSSLSTPSPPKAKKTVVSTVKKGAAKEKGGEAPPPASSTHPAFRLTNEQCLQLFKAMRTPEEFLTAFEKSDYEKFIRGALKASCGPLDCMQCGKEISTAMGMVLHLNSKKCSRPEKEKEEKGAESGEAKETPKAAVRACMLQSGRGKKSTKTGGNQYTVEINSIEQLESEPSLWFRIQSKDKTTLLKNLWGDGPYPCFAFRDPTDTDKKMCSSLNAFSGLRQAVSHLDSCIKPMYFTFSGDRLSLLRALDQKTKSRYVREAMTLAHDGFLPCLECGRRFNHHYGLIYHLDRCNVDDSVRPWKCYRCGFQTTVSNSQAHLNQCWAGQVHATKEERDYSPISSLPAVMGYLGDVNLRSGKSILRGAGSIELDGIEQSIEKIDAKEAITALINHDAINKLRGVGVKHRLHSRASISAGVLPAESSRVRVSNGGLLRFRFRKAETSDDLSTIPNSTSWDTYSTYVSTSSDEWFRDSSSLSLCQPLSDMIKQDWSSLRQSPSSCMDIEKQSINFRLNNSLLPPQPLPEGAFPMGCRRLLSLQSSTLSSEDDDSWSAVAYTGGPIHTIKFAPNALSDTDEVLCVLTFPSDHSLTEDGWRTRSGIIQLWILRHDPSTNRCIFLPWFVLQPSSSLGLILSASWLDRPSIREEGSDDVMLGLLALSTAQGSILIYRIDSSTVPLPVDDVTAPPLIQADPQIILTQPATPPVVNLEDEEDDDMDGDDGMKSYAPPLTRIAWCSMDQAQHIAAVSATGSVVLWDLSSSLSNPQFLRDPSWCSPAHDVCFAKDYELVVAFREKNVRVYDIRTWSCVLEEATVRTAGCRVVSEPRVFAGLLTFQSEYIVGGDVPATGASYIACDPQSQGYFVVPIANRHSLQTWDCSISSLNGVIASVGVDGQLLHSSNGRMTARRSLSDCNFSVMRAALQLTKQTLSSPTSSASFDDEEDSPSTKPSQGLLTHHEMEQKLWIDVSLRPTKNHRNIEYSSLDTRVESLNAVSTNRRGEPMTVCGGQAGLMFCRPCSVQSEGSLVDPSDWLAGLFPLSSTSSTPNSKKARRSQKR